MTADYKALLQKKAELDAQIADALKSEKGSAIAQAQELVQQYGLTQNDIFGQQKRKGSVGEAKYRDPSTGVTWTGRGKPPNWILGKDRVAFEI